MSIGRFVSRPALFWLGVTGLLVAFAELYRLILLIYTADLARDIPGDVLVRSFLIGARFDLVIAAFVTLPMYFLSILPWLEISRRRFMRRIVFVLFAVATAVTSFANLVDLEFFAFFNARLNGMALTWSDTPGMMTSFVWETFPVIRWLLLWATLLAGLFWLVRKWYRFAMGGHPPSSIWVNLAWLPITLLILGVSARGRIETKSPIRTGVAYFSQYDYANQLALNPAFTFWRDAFYDARNRDHLEAMMNNIEAPEAAELVRRQFGMDVDTLLDLSTRLVRHHAFDPPADRRANVFLVMMESFAATKIGVLDNRHGVELSPCFDSLASGGTLFDSIYSCGMHTYTGLFSTMTGMPHQFTELIMKQVPGQAHLWSLARILQKHGYRTFFFTTHDPHFDNMQGFVMQNGVMKTISGLDFASDDKIGTWGVPDHVMFDRAIQELSLPSDSPFFAILLTTTNHGPWNVPDVPFERVPDSVDKAVELNAFKYSDWALGRFVRQVQTNATLGNTLLFITADNGDPFQPKLSLDLTQYHIPLLILDTDCRIPAPVRNHTLGSQLDILATVMGRLRLDYDDYSFGNDLLDTSAAATRFAHFSEWYQIGHIEDGYYLIYAIREKRRWLYRMGELDRELSDSLPGLADSLESKAKAIFKAGYEQMHLPLAPFARDH